MELKCNTNEGDSVSGHNVEFEVTFYSPSLHATYTYGIHKPAFDGDIAIDNHMRATFK